MLGFEWQDGYGGFTVSKSQVRDLIEYIKNQREHHRKKTFQEEYLELLKKHGVDYDERYLTCAGSDAATRRGLESLPKRDLNLSFMKALKSLGCFLLLLAVASIARAGIRPSFLPEVCAWRATDIIVVTEGQEIDGVFTILETLKGDLKPGETLTIPEMAEFKSAEARLINQPWYEQQQRGKAKEYVTCNRMILFLRDSKKPQLWLDDDQEEEEGPAKKSPSRWQAANLMGDEIKYSAVWIEKDQVHCFIQEMNPGPSLLLKLGVSEDKLKKQLAEVINVQDGLKAAIAIQDSVRKSQGLEAFLHSEIYLARERAFAELINCDEAALPVLKAVLNDESLLWIQADAIDTLAEIGGRKIGPELTAILERETEFWKQKAPALRLDWRNVYDTKGDSALLRAHWAVWSQALSSLSELRYPGAKSAVAEVRELMLSTPQVYDQGLSNTCDEILRTLRGTGEPPPTPHYELRLTGNKAFSTDQLKAIFAQALTDYQRLQRPYTPDMFIYALDQIGSFISSQGYTANGSGPPLAESSDDSGVVISSVRASDHEQSAIGRNKQGVVVFLHVNEGKRFRLGSVKIEGAHLFSPKQIREMLSLRSGDICDFVAIETWRSSLEQAYKNRGYLQVSVEDESDQYPPSRGQESGTVNFKLKITEGRPFTVQSIKFEGKSEIPSSSLLGALKLAERELYSEEKLDASLTALNDLGLDVEKEDDVHIKEDEEKGLVSIVIFLDKRTSRRSSGQDRLRRRVRRIFN